MFLRFLKNIVLALLMAITLYTVAARGAWASDEDGLAGEEVVTIIETVFADEPEIVATMVEIANCESTGLIHRLPDGSLRPNDAGSSAKGAFQVLFSIHKEEASRLGFGDIEIDDDAYFAYVRYLYDRQGLQPWTETRRCWG